METFRVSMDASGGYALTGDTVRLASECPKVTIDGQACPLHFEGSDRKKMSLGALSGVVYGGASNQDGIAVRRELFLSVDGHTAALRVTLKNNRSKAIRLQTVEPMRMARQSSFIVGDAGIDRWRVLRYPFHKSDIPSYYRPTVVDKDFTDAVFSCINAVPGKGVLYNTMNVETRTITSGPVMMVKNGERPDLPILMLAITNIRNHFILQSLTTTEDRSSFADFTITCDFDGKLLEPGEEAETHWLLIATGGHEGELLGRYTATVAELYSVPEPRKPSLTVYCTWYFYTFLVCERYVLEELAAIKARRIPLDVFQIDDGWMDTYGAYEPHPEKFPRGMKFIADRIREAGMIPGIWAAPFVIDSKSSVVQKYPDIYQKDQNGQLIIYDTSDRYCYVLDPTAPDADAYLRDIFGKFKGWGFRYFKLDWLRAVYEFPNVVFRDPKVNRAAAYALAMSRIREVLGSDAFILACGGLADPGGIGLAYAVRTSKDVRGIWNGPEGVAKSGAVIQLKQNLLRSYVNRFYHSDPDATQIRIRKGRFSELETKCVGVYQSEGHYTDEEARTICTHQYLCGGLITISERFPELQDERLALLRHISPAVTPPARILDFDAPACPTLFLTEVKPVCRELGDYWTLAIGNWEDHVTTRVVTLGGMVGVTGRAVNHAIFEFHTQRFLGIFGPQDTIKVEIPAHGVRVLRIVPWTGRAPVVLGTDLHMTGGAAEIKELVIGDSVIRGKIETRWQYPVVITAGFPDNGKVTIRKTTVPVGGGTFECSL
ncbi:MAG: alpha-galactosidase [Kiritimatiellae bacterium]|nr:alpha-galactosidase [Kiritimatiellia bacterium]